MRSNYSWSITEKKFKHYFIILSKTVVILWFFNEVRYYIIMMIVRESVLFRNITVIDLGQSEQSFQMELVKEQSIFFNWLWAWCYHNISFNSNYLFLNIGSLIYMYFHPSSENIGLSSREINCPFSVDYFLFPRLPFILTTYVNLYVRRN